MADAVELEAWGEWASRAYGSLSDPNFSFVAERYNQNPYAEQIREMMGIANVADSTGLDDDVCFRLEVGGGRWPAWRVLLSMVGPFAMVIKIDRVGRLFPNVISTPVVMSSHPVGGEILRILKTAGFHILSAEESKINVAFKVPPDEELEDGPLYRVLFSDASELPW
ncbi:hypothetical protein OHV13_33745 [Kitasatospora purpeofusca]|uniref:hypothetical protein n=1 Tax=Kitasatospora purpeofusca TaxID=67352 RepID=UPI003246DF80